MLETHLTDKETVIPRYGYVTNTSVKFVAILQDAPTRESELRSVRRGSITLIANESTDDGLCSFRSSSLSSYTRRT